MKNRCQTVTEGVRNVVGGFDGRLKTWSHIHVNNLINKVLLGLTCLQYSSARVL